MPINTDNYPERKYKFYIYKIADIEGCKTKLRSKNYDLIPLDNSHKELKLYVGAANKSPKWVDILSSITESSSEFRNVKNTNYSFVLLIESNQETFAVCGGPASNQIQAFIENDFGLDVVSRIVDPSKIKLTRSKHLTGKTAEEQTIHKEYNYNFDDSNYGKIIKHILGEISKIDLDKYLGISDHKQYKIKLDGKNSISLNRSISITDLKLLIQNIQILLRDINPKFKINIGYKEVKDKGLKEKLWSELINNLQSQYEVFLFNKEEYEETNIGVSYSDIKEFLLCDAFQVHTGQRITMINSDETQSLGLANIFQAFRVNRVKEISRHLLDSTHVEGLDAEGVIQIDNKFKAFLYAEIKISKILYFLVDQKWFSVENDFREHINKKLKDLLQDSRTSAGAFSLPPWQVINKKVETEDSYIDKVCKDKSLLKLHRNHIVLKGVDKTEVCDIVDIRAKKTNFIVVKRGLGSSFREMLAQTRTSAELFKYDNYFISEAQKKIDAEAKTPVDCTQKNLNIVMAFTDKSIRSNSLEDRLTTIVKMDLVKTLEFLRKDLDYKESFLYEIPHT